VFGRRVGSGACPFSLVKECMRIAAGCPHHHHTRLVTMCSECLQSSWPAMFPRSSCPQLLPAFYNFSLDDRHGRHLLSWLLIRLTLRHGRHLLSWLLIRLTLYLYGFFPCWFGFVMSRDTPGVFGIISESIARRIGQVCAQQHVSVMADKSIPCD